MEAVPIQDNLSDVLIKKLELFSIVLSRMITVEEYENHLKIYFGDKVYIVRRKLKKFRKVFQKLNNESDIEGFNNFLLDKKKDKKIIEP